MYLNDTVCQSSSLVADQTRDALGGRGVKREHVCVTRRGGLKTRAKDEMHSKAAGRDVRACFRPTTGRGRSTFRLYKAVKTDRLKISAEGERIAIVCNDGHETGGNLDNSNSFC